MDCVFETDRYLLCNYDSWKLQRSYQNRTSGQIKVSVFLFEDLQKTSIKFRTEMPNYEMYKSEETTWERVYHTCSQNIPTDAPEHHGK